MPTAPRMQNSAGVPLAFVCLLWLVYLVTQFIPQSGLQSLGIVPRTIGGLRGIIFAPLLHYNLYHLAANTLPCFVLLFLLGLQSGKRWLEILAMLWLGAGLGTWLIGRPNTTHIGASAVVYGLITYLIAAGFYHRDWKSIVIGAVVLFSYGTLLWRILPNYFIISWEGHLCGAVAGIVIASISGKTKLRKAR